MTPYEVEVISVAAEHELTDAEAARRLGWERADVIAAVDRYHAAGLKSVDPSRDSTGSDVVGPRS